MSPSLGVLIKEPTCFQLNNSSQIDFILANQKFSITFEAGLSDHHKLISTISKSGSYKRTPRIKVCRSYKYYRSKTKQFVKYYI